MRNFLIFPNLLNNDYINNMDKIYLKFKNLYLEHKNDLLDYKKTINNENVYYKNLLNNINNDFIIYHNNLNNTDLLKQYINVINNTDNQYNNKINTINYKIYLHKNDTEILIKLLLNIINNLKKYKLNLYKLQKNTKINKNSKNLKQYIHKILAYKNICNNKLNNSLTNLLKKEQNTIELVKKINYLSNILKKNDNILKNLEISINNTQNKKDKNLLKIFYNNINKNNLIFVKKLELYYLKLNNLTNKIDTNTNINDKLLNELEHYIEKKNNNSIKLLLKKIIFKNSNNTKVNKFENLVTKLKLLKY